MATAVAGRRTDVTPSSAAAYRTVLALPGVGALTATGFVARLPTTAAGVFLTLYVALGTGRGFAAAGLVGAAITVGTAVGAPLLGRIVDRRGLRPVLGLAAAAQATFWSVAPWLGWGLLTIGAFAAGILSVPAFSVVRQALATAVPPEHRRPAFALDAMSAELSYIVGPALGTAIALSLPAEVSMRLVGLGFVLAAALLWWLDPRTHEERAPDDEPRPSAPPVRTWMSRSMVVALGSATAAILLLTATELGVVAALSARGETGWFALTNTVWCAASLVGGYIHGSTRRPRPLPVLLGGLAAASVPVAIGGPWWVVSILLVPAGAFCAPALAASAETVGRLAPPAARGVATGLHGSAVTLGQAVAAPLSGLLIDVVAPGAAILTAAGIAGATALIAAAAATRFPARQGGGQAT